MPRETTKYLLPLLLLALGCPPASSSDGDAGDNPGVDGSSPSATDAATAQGDGGGVLVTGDAGTVASDDGGALAVGDGGALVVGDGGVAVLGDGGTVLPGDGGTLVPGDGGSAGPWTLVGFSSRSVADGGSLLELRAIDPVSGKSTIVKARPEMAWAGTGANAYAPALKRIHVMGGGPGEYRVRVFTVDAVSGDLVYNPEVELMAPATYDGGYALEYNWSGGLGVRSDGTLVGLTWYQGGDAGVEQVRSINPATGSTALVGSAPGLDWVVSGSNGFDPVRDLFYVIGSSSADMRERLFTVDAKTGAVLSSPALDTAPTDGGFGPSWSAGLAVRSDGTLVGIAVEYAMSGPGVAELRSIDPATGKTTLIKQIPGLSWVLSGEVVLDRARDVIWAIGGFGQEAELRVVGIDARTGEVVATPSLDGSDGGRPDGGFWGSSWTGGLYIAR